jgi:hypothetical protein
MSKTPNLILPYIDAAQVQKHVTHNAALTAPPASPVDGERHLLALGATGTPSGITLTACSPHTRGQTSVETNSKRQQAGRRE